MYIPIIELLKVGESVYQHIQDKKQGKEDELLREYESYLNFYEMLVSLWGHAAFVDGKIQEEEKDFVKSTLMEFCFVENEEMPVFSKNMLKKMKTNEDKIINELVKKFKKPSRLINIYDYAIQYGMENIFYTQALQLMTSDKIVFLKERIFLNTLSNNLKLSKDEVKSIESEYLIGYKEERKFLWIFSFYKIIK